MSKRFFDAICAVYMRPVLSSAMSTSMQITIANSNMHHTHIACQGRTDLMTIYDGIKSDRHFTGSQYRYNTGQAPAAPVNIQTSPGHSIIT